MLAVRCGRDSTVGRVLCLFREGAYSKGRINLFENHINQTPICKKIMDF